MSQSPRLTIVRSNDVRSAQAQMEKTLAKYTEAPRYKCAWGLRLNGAWHRWSTGGIVRYASKESAETFGLPVVRNTGAWRVEKMPWWLATYDSFMWLFVFGRRRR